MSVHQKDKNALPDSDFIKGELSYMREGNSCRLLDARRTPGVIEKVCFESAMFRWRISKFEDEGKSWDVPVEEFVRYQFSKDSEKIQLEQERLLGEKVKKFKTKLNIDVEASTFSKRLKENKELAVEWLLENSAFIKKNSAFDFSQKRGDENLRADLLKYMEEFGFLEQEQLTSETYVLNPKSGEWIKGLQIVMAENGLGKFESSITRTPNVFEGVGAKDKRLNYICARMAFLSGLFSIKSIEEVTLYRGAAIEGDWKSLPKQVLSSWTFSKEVAEAFCSLETDSKFKHSYLFKRSVPVGQLFMTYLETEAMNNQYDELEAVVISKEHVQPF